MATMMIRRMLVGGGVLALVLSSWALAEDGTEATDQSTNAGADHRAEIASTKIAAAGDQTTAADTGDEGESTVDAEVAGQPSAEDLPEAAAFGICVSNVAPAEAPEGGDNPAETCRDLQNGASEDAASDDAGSEPEVEEAESEEAESDDAGGARGGRPDGDDDTEDSAADEDGSES